MADGGNGGRWNIDSSYGRSSPGTRDGIFSFHVYYGGVVGNYYQHVDGSYGMIYTANNKFKFRSPGLDSGSNDYAYHVRPDGDVDTYWPVDGDVFFDPCGRSSPDTIGPSYSKDVTYTGEVMGNYANGSVSNSYGIFYQEKSQISLSEPQQRQLPRPCVLC